MRCPGSVQFIEEHGEEEGGVHADEGTLLHEFCEEALREGKDAYDFVGETRTLNDATVEFDDDLADMMQAGLDRIDSIPGKLFIEQWIKLDRWMPKQGGTLDVGIAGKKWITIYDWKWGANPVSPIRNEQLSLYALGFYETYAKHITDAKRFRLIIEQPRAPGGGGEWETDLDELLEFGRDVKDRARLCLQKDAPRVPGPVQCMYCPGAKSMSCKEYVEYNLALVIEDFDRLDEDVELDVPPFLSTKGLTPERRGYILENRAAFTKFLDRLHAQALDDALKGRPTPGQKVVFGRKPARRWRSGEKTAKAVEAFLGPETYDLKLKSPTQVEKLLSESQYKKLAHLVDQGEPKPTLVSIDDTRPPIPPLNDLFED